MRIRRDHFGLDASTRLALATVSALMLAAMLAVASLRGLAYFVRLCSE